MQAERAEPVEAADAATFAKSIPLIKGVDPDDERYVLGVVLEPEVIDAQGDIYSPEEIRQAAHRFMEEFGGLGLMHRMRVNGQVKVLESYVSPVDFTVGEVSVRKGTWLLAVRILSDALWEQVKSGELTGFSIGGSARRVPEPEAAAPEPQTEGCVMPDGKAERAVHRLLDMVVEEVSLVDRAANQHRFLIVKRSEPMDQDTTAADAERDAATDRLRADRHPRGRRRSERAARRGRRR